MLVVYADSCPVARSIKDSIEISSELDLTTRQRKLFITSSRVVPILESGDVISLLFWRIS